MKKVIRWVITALCGFVLLYSLYTAVVLVRQNGWESLPSLLISLCCMIALMGAILTVLWRRAGPGHAVPIDHPAEPPNISRMKDPEDGPDWEEDV